ncbi:Sec14-Like Protein 4 [Manis pentadactyla]|nr:Sec14-Like Protein 4 [Manis pentadactyla]
MLSYSGNRSREEKTGMRVSEDVLCPACRWATSGRNGGAPGFFYGLGSHFLGNMSDEPQPAKTVLPIYHLQAGLVEPFAFQQCICSAAAEEDSLVQDEVLVGCDVLPCDQR